MSLKTLRVLVVGGLLAAGRTLATLAGLMPEFTVVGRAHLPVRGLQRAIETAPDVTIVDADLPGLWSSAMIRRLRWRLPTTRVIALGTDPEQRRAALEAGAHAFVPKGAGHDVLHAAIVGDDGSTDLPRGAGARAAQRDRNHGRAAS
jgi:CheY-like chemotaxis protein